MEKPSALPRPIPVLENLHRVREPGSEIGAYVNLDRNERAQPLPDWFMEAVRQSLQSSLLTTYPLQDRLYQQLSAFLQLPEEQLLLTAGSDPTFKAPYHAYVCPGDTVVMLEPSYAMYEVYAQMFQARACQIPFNLRLEIDVEQLLDSIVPGVRLVVIANPNQPTATLLNEDVLLQLIQRTSEVGALLAVDEAYFPFSHTTVLPWGDHVPHLLVARTFSKAAGLAGLRIGFVAGHQEVLTNLYKVRSAHDINSMAILCASQILKHPEVVNDYVDEIEVGGQVLVERSRGLGLVPLPTYTNFILIRVAPRYQPAWVIEQLRRHGYLVKGPFSAACLADCIRVTLGPPTLMMAFADALEQVLSTQSEKPESV